MKFSNLALAFLPSVAAFSPSMIENRRVANGVKAEAAMVSDIVVQRPLFDPLGLYPDNSPERLAGLIIPLETSYMEQERTVIDPLSIYQDKSEITSDVEVSASLPFLSRPAMLDRSLPGDRGFDPFNFSSDAASLQWYRNSEVKHARLAMLAAAGWPLAELFHKNIASALDLNAVLVNQDRVPSVLNGGLSHISLAFWVAAFGAAATTELVLAVEASQSSKVNPGDLGFDPLGLGGKTDEQKYFMQEAELFNGRLGMIAITGFAIQEWWLQSSVVNQIPIFFKPLNVALEQLMEAGSNSL